jgi:hypothetical protein
VLSLSVQTGDSYACTQRDGKPKDYLEQTQLDLWQHSIIISVLFVMVAVPVFADFSHLPPCHPPSLIPFHLFSFVASVQQWLQPTAHHILL